jgi:Secretion system C-terminal sorting domain
MKAIFTLFVTISALITAGTAKAGTTYNITSNSNWSTFTIPTTCANCTIKISAGVTLTIDKSVTCQQCTIQGGNLSMGSFTLNLQFISSNTPTVFTGVNFNVTGSGTVTANAPLDLTNSNFTFNNTSSITTSYDLIMVSSKIHLYGNSAMTNNGGGGTNISLSNSSEIVIGDGTSTSKASLLVSGPSLNIYDNSNVAVRGNNNDYKNWSNFNTAPNAASPSGSQKNYPSFNNSNPNNNMNCGIGYPNSCSNPNLYGPSTLSSSGVSLGATILPILLEGFAGELNSDETVGLSWTTAQESNSGHFEIERSLDGSVWTIIGEEAAKGYSSLPSDYSFTDGKPSAGTNYYRLRMVDLDGKYTYTTIVVIHNASIVSHTSFFPNPAHDYVHVALGGVAATKLTIRLINQSGQVLQEKTVVAGNGVTVSFPVQQYAAGLYILSVDGSDGTHTSSKLLISRS